MATNHSESEDQLNQQHSEFNSPKSFLKRLSNTSSSGLESVAGEFEAINSDRAKNSVDATRAMLSQLNAPRETQEQILLAAESGMQKLSNEGDEAKLNPVDIVGLEAIVMADGSRPVLFVQDDQIDIDAEDLGEWKFSATQFSDSVTEVAQSVGRITDPSIPQQLGGSCFAIAPGLVVTNRHVLQVIANEQNSNGNTAWSFHDNVVVDFKAEHERDSDENLIFPVIDVEFFGPERILNSGIDFEKLDIAILKCDVPDDKDFPVGLELEKEPTKIFSERDVYVMGFPGKPSSESADLLTTLFENTFGVKRWAPGQIIKVQGELNGDGKQWCMTHDATTLGGNSGSVIVEFSDVGYRVVGLHFGGWRRRENYAHVIAKLKDFIEPLGGNYF